MAVIDRASGAGRFSTLIGEMITHGSALEGKIAGFHFRNLFLPAPSFSEILHFFL